MQYIVLGVIVWALVGTGVALLLGRAINLADRHEHVQRETTLGATHPGH
jgi:hypothetical protein